MDDYGAQLKVGMMFRNRDSFKQHIAMFAIAKKFCYCSVKSDPSMMILKCISSTCPWRVYATKLKDSEVFEMLAIPCSHAIAAALKAKINVEELVIDEYKLDSLNRAYEGIILPESASPVGVGMPSIVSDL
uniref:Transposase MuDR plant domain-containing protein n=1 Tax=Brassica oleracea var. oleracea TaxID=109376 RepID=A0A0D3C000_BRAOL